MARPPQKARKLAWGVLWWLVRKALQRMRDSGMATLDGDLYRLVISP